MANTPREEAESMLEGVDIKVLVELKRILNEDEIYSILIDDYERSSYQEDELLNF